MQKLIFDFVSKHDWNDPIALTLTEKQADCCKLIDHIQSAQNTRLFINRLNYSIYGNAYRRFGKRIPCFVVMEGDSVHRHHLHLLIDKPQRFSLEQFTEVVRDSWSKTPFGHNEIDAKPVRDQGWLRYILKRRSKTDFTSSIDWENTHLVNTSLLN